jgi:asparagine synthase (glutamine-hydrolysing)
MCGIAGVLFLDDDRRPRRRQPPPAYLATLQQRLAHRGPDGAGVFVDDGVGLVHTRLAINDAHGGRQPLSTPDGRFTLVVNGEVYGHRRHRLRLQAAGAQFSSASDAEVLLWTLSLHGVDGLDDLEGEFAFCFWDGLARQAILGRDLLGVKPLVWHRRGPTVWFASEAQALAAVLPAVAVDFDVVADTVLCPPLSGSDRLPFVGLECLPAGAVALADGRGPPRIVRQARHRLGGGTLTSPSPLALREALQVAVDDRLDADVPVGAFLSGGVDSTSIVAMALTGATGPLPCFTIRFDAHDDANDDDGGRGRVPGNTPGSIVVGDDAPFVEELARTWPLALTRVKASRRALLDELEPLWASQDRVAAWEQELSQRFLARAAARTVKAVLVGDAADETHFGYAFAFAPDVVGHPADFMNRFGARRRQRLLLPGLQRRFDAVVNDALGVAEDDGTPFGPGLDRGRMATSTVILRRWLPRLLHNGDLHTMAFGLEARVPFADRRVLNVASRIGLADGWSDNVDDTDPVPEKRVLRRAVADLVPDTIRRRRKSALPRDDGLGDAYQARLAAALLGDDTRARLARVFDIDAISDLANPAVTHIDDEVRAVLFSVLSVDGFLRHHGS